MQKILAIHSYNRHSQLKIIKAEISREVNLASSGEHVLNLQAALYYVSSVVESNHKNALHYYSCYY